MQGASTTTKCWSGDRPRKWREPSWCPKTRHDVSHSDVHGWGYDLPVFCRSQFHCWKASGPKTIWVNHNMSLNWNLRPVGDDSPNPVPNVPIIPGFGQDMRPWSCLIPRRSSGSAVCAARVRTLGWMGMFNTLSVKKYLKREMLLIPTSNQPSYFWGRCPIPDPRSTEQCSKPCAVLLYWLRTWNWWILKIPDIDQMWLYSIISTN